MSVQATVEYQTDVFKEFIHVVGRLFYSNECIVVLDYFARVQHALIENDLFSKFNWKDSIILKTLNQLQSQMLLERVAEREKGSKTVYMWRIPRYVFKAVEWRYQTLLATLKADIQRNMECDDFLCIQCNKTIPVIEIANCPLSEDDFHPLCYICHSRLKSNSDTADVNEKEMFYEKTVASLTCIQKLLDRVANMEVPEFQPLNPSSSSEELECTKVHSSLNVSGNTSVGNVLSQHCSRPITADDRSSSHELSDVPGITTNSSRLISDQKDNIRVAASKKAANLDWFTNTINKPQNPEVCQPSYGSDRNPKQHFSFSFDKIDKRDKIFSFENSKLTTPLSNSSLGSTRDFGYNINNLPGNLNKSSLPTQSKAKSFISSMATLSSPYLNSNSESDVNSVSCDQSNKSSSYSKIATTGPFLPPHSPKELNTVGPHSSDDSVTHDRPIDSVRSPAKPYFQSGIRIDFKSITNSNASINKCIGKKINGDKRNASVTGRVRLC